MQLGGGRVATREARPPVKDRHPASALPSRAARQLLQHCLNTAQQGPRRQLEPQSYLRTREVDGGCKR
jgi:hypothetical protein